MQPLTARTSATFALGLVVALSPAVRAETDAKAPPTATVMTEGQPVTVPRALQYDLTSRINGRQYRIMVSTPYKADPNKAYPVFYVLDGNWYFRAVSDNVIESGNTITQAIVVGIGYPTEINDEVHHRRAFELTLPGGPKLGSSPSGGGDDFLRVLLEEVKPFVQAHYKVDATRQTLYGKSLGGLMVLHALFRHPGEFQTYIAASPAISWNNKAVLADEAAFSTQAKAGTLHLKLLITSASEEQYHGTDPARLEAEALHGGRMVSNAGELAGRLAKLNPSNVVVHYVIFPDETHVSVSLTSLGRALNFALPPR